MGGTGEHSECSDSPCGPEVALWESRLWHPRSARPPDGYRFPCLFPWTAFGGTAADAEAGVASFRMVRYPLGRRSSE
jgi:hypothetical protein